MNRRDFLGSAVFSTGAVIVGTGTEVASGATSSAQPAQALSLDQVRRSIPFAQHGRRVRQAPFGGDVSRAVANYNRASPYIATAGLLHKGGLEEARRLGFRLIIDLRAPSERGVDTERALAARLDVAWLNLPIDTGAPGWNQVEEFAVLAHDAERYPMLVHCVSSDRSGALWALYRSAVGVPAEIAVEEGRAAGLESREEAVRAQLGLG